MEQTQYKILRRDNSYPYVTWIPGKITIYCNNKEKIQCLKSLGAKKNLFSRNPWMIHYETERDLAIIFSKLRDCDFLFSFDEHGWSASEVFQNLREKHFIQGKFLEISWCQKDKVLVRTL